MLLALILSTFFIFITVLFSSSFYEPNPKIKQPTQEHFALKAFLVFFVFCFIRLLLAAFTKGYDTDMSCWAAWGDRFLQVGTQNFYAPDYFCDYPPGYLYILGFLARLIAIFQIPAVAQPFIYKLPAVISDLLLFGLLLNFSKKYWSCKSALLLAGFFLLAPIFWFDSAVWGQVESVLLLFLTVSLLKLYEKKYTSSILLFVLAVLMKPQGLILAPLYLFALIETKSIKTILISALSGILLFVICIMPFSSAWQTETGLAAFLASLNPLWIIEKYSNTLASYPYFTVNAFNLYGLLGLNWVSLDIANPTFITIFQGSMIGIAVLGGFFLYYKIKPAGSRLFLSAYFLFAFLYTFSFKMHERYVILPLFFLFLDFLVSKNRKILFLFSGLSSVCFLNMYYILHLSFNGNSAPIYGIVGWLSFFEVALFLWSLWVIYRDYIQAPKSMQENEINGIKPLRTSKKIFKSLSTHKKEKKMLRIDYYMLCGIVLLYSLTAFINLGDISAPQTYYQPKEIGETFTIVLDKPYHLSEINYYCGIGDLDETASLRFSYSQDGENFTEIDENFCQTESVFCWKTQTLSAASVKYLRGIAQNTNYTLYEIGLRDDSGNLIPISHIEGINKDSLSYMIDEQALVTNQPSYKNGTYFDEIYHPRTAYEHLHGMPYYETTHPPLGKLMMSMGIALFGMSPFGWRCMGTLIGVLMLPTFYLFIKRLFGRTRYAVIGTLLFAFDFMHFSLTRIGTIDTYPVFFILCMYYFMYRFGESAFDWAKGNQATYKKQLVFLFLSGLSMGLGCASKWTAIYASFGLAIVFAAVLIVVYQKLGQEEKSRFLPYLFKTGGWCFLFFIFIPATIYTLSYLPISMVDGYGTVFEAMWNNQEYMLSYHSNLSGTHPYSSPWYTWPFVYKPMWAYQAPEVSVAANQIGCISIFQNPLISWLGVFALVFALIRGYQKRDFRVLFLLIGILAQYLPWALVSRYALQYHFFASLPFMILFIVYAMEDLEWRFPKVKPLTIAITILALVMFIAFYPVISGTPVSRFYAETFLTWFDSWVFFI